MIAGLTAEGIRRLHEVTQRHVPEAGAGPGRGGRPG